MGLFSDFVVWLLIGNGGWWIGGTLIATAVFASIWLGIQRYGGVCMTDPVIPPVTREIQRIGPETYVWPTTPMPPANWTPLAERFAAAVEETAAAVLDLTDTVQHAVVDPFAATAELERIDPDLPLFYTIKRPAPPPRLESHTQQWERDGLLARIREAAGEMAP